MNKAFIGKRITQLRKRKGVSEYQMSRDLGHSRGYLYNISSEKSLPPLQALFDICDYFGITLAEFFEEDNKYPEVFSEAMKKFKKLKKDDQLMMLEIIDRLLK